MATHQGFGRLLHSDEIRSDIMDGNTPAWMYEFNTCYICGEEDKPLYDYNVYRICDNCARLLNSHIEAMRAHKKSVADYWVSLSHSPHEIEVTK